jgi:uncharacterized protein DUF4365
MGKAGAIATEDQIGRWGVMYVRSILAQAAVVNNEVPGGEDHLAVDLALIFPVGSVTAQVKTGTKKPNRDGSITVSVEESWKKKWAEAKTPVYLVYVYLEKKPPLDWAEHADAHTTLHARGHWIRVNAVSAASVRVPVSNRLTADTFDEWVGDFNALYGKAASA